MMRIGLITGEYPPLQGGISAHVDVLTRYLHRQGHDVFVFSDKRAKQQSSDIALNNSISTWGYRTNRLVNQWAHQQKLDILNLHFQTAAFDMSPWIHLMPHMLDIPFVTTFHDLRFPYLFPKAGFLRDWIVMHLAKSSDGVIVTNHEDLQSVQELQSTMIPIGSSILANDSPDRDRWRARMNITSDEFLLAHFGFINHSKGVDTLLYALASFNDPRIKLLMIGGRTGTADPNNATYADTIDAMIKQLGLEAQVIWTGFVEESMVSAYLETADALILPFRDGASFRRSSLMAAIERACPIITTQPALSIPEFTDDVMMLVEPDNVEQLATTINQLKQSPEKREQLHQNVVTLRQRFDWEVITRDTVSFFEQVIGDCR